MSAWPQVYRTGLEARRWVLWFWPAATWLERPESVHPGTLEVMTEAGLMEAWDTEDEGEPVRMWRLTAEGERAKLAEVLRTRGPRDGALGAGARGRR